MPSRKTTKAAAAAAARMPSIPKELVDQFVTGPMSAEAVQDISMAFKKALIERALGAELSHHLGYPPGAGKPEESANHRNGASAKTVITDDGPVRIEVPRDREGSFEPQIIGKHERRFTGFDQKIVAMYARGMTVREIQGYLMEMYGTEVSPEFISKVTDEVMAEVVAWQSRPLEPMYPVVFFDALRVKIRDDAVVRNKAVYLALGVLPDGSRDVLGIWIEQTEGAKFWLKVFNDLKTRGCRHPDRRGRRPEGAGRGDRGGVPGHDGADLHRAPDPQQPGLRDLEGPQGRGSGAASGLHGGHRSGRAGGARRVRRQRLGREVPDDRASVEARLGARDPLLRLPAGSASRGLHDQRDRESAHAAQEDHQDARAFPQRRGGDQAAVAGASQRDEQVGKIDPRMEERNESIRDPVRRTIHELTPVKPASHTEFLTGPHHSLA